MTKHNAANERIKHAYFRYLAEAHGRDEATINAVAKSIARFEESTRWRDFKLFRHEQAIAFKAKLAQVNNARTGEKLSKATLLSTLRDLRAFFFWLAHTPGFKSRIRYDDADYFNLSDKDAAIARAKRPKRSPSIDQICHTLATMPAETTLQRRDRALVAFAAITAARVAALASFRVEHVNLAERYVDQDARVVRTKFAKTFRTFFMVIDEGALTIVREWVEELQRDHLWGPSDPLFPSTMTGVSQGGGFAATGIARHGWASSEPIRKIFKHAFEAAGLPYFNPHSFRGTLAQAAMAQNLSPEAMKAWSQNLGHDDVLTTFTSYGNVPVHRQGQLIREGLRQQHGPTSLTPQQVDALRAILAQQPTSPGLS